MENVHRHIEHSISRRKKGELIFPTDFRGKGTQTAVKTALSRLSREGKLKRLAHGIYYVPKTDPLFGVIYPAPEEVAESIAKKEKVRIKPAGAYALHRLGLTTQVPTKLVYITDGENRQIKIGKTVIRFKATTPKKMSLEGQLSSLVILALDELNIANIDSDTTNKIRAILQKENPGQLKRNLLLTSARIHDYILKLLK
ncbi:MAG: type IV toxin-antitoxin system AbiEi family antitoxin domain-containing protein [Bacteroidetes bacterium]|nr:type IV toxin-antitoxin system AbiEi family antitoxin domain-containing protein [Bacteroidota bacterium]